MSFMLETLQEEYERLERILKSYQDKVDSLPKGVIRYKASHNKKYAYLHYREGLKVIDKYINTSDINLNEFINKIKQRQKIEKDIVEIKKDLKLLRKVIKNGK